MSTAVSTEGLPDWSHWTPVNPTSTDTFKMRVPGGWLVRVYDAEVRKPAHDIAAYGLTNWHGTGTSHVLFVPDPKVP